tara:strand:- start:466 stop:1659 length:1194 start_codon:yes stop_codon:yes gene_type:complete
MQNNLNSFNKVTPFTLLLIPLLIVIPKVNLISIPGFWQGIRLEDIITFLILIYMILNSKNYALKLDDPNTKFFLFISYVLASYLVGYLSGISYGYIDIITIVRIIEYSTIILFFSNVSFTSNHNKKIIIFLKVLIVINFLVSIGQYFEIVGYYSSRGYHEPDFDYWRAFGILSGSWELSFVTSISYFLIYLETRKKFNIYLILSLIIIFLAGTRGIQYPFILTIVILYFPELIKIQSKLKFIIYTFIFVLIFYFMYFVQNINIFFLVKSLFDLMFYGYVPDFSDLSKSEVVYYSWVYRLKDWLNYYQLMNTNLFTFLFGTGFSSIYYESFIFRILFGTGLVGFFLLILLCFRLNIFIIFFLFITGITLDFTSSFKQFIILYFFFQYMRSYNKNEISN